MIKPRHSNWIWLLLGVIGLLGAGGLAQTAGGDGGYPAYLPAIMQVVASYLPQISTNSQTYPYIMEPDDPKYRANIINSSGCNWFGVVGRVFGPDGNTVLDLTVHLEGGGLSADAVTGQGPALIGRGAYLIVLGDHPVATRGVYSIQLRDNAGTPLSDVYPVTTYADCGGNMLTINFLARQPVYPTTAPTVQPPTQAPPGTPTLGAYPGPATSTPGGPPPTSTPTPAPYPAPR